MVPAMAVLHTSWLIKWGLQSSKNWESRYQPVLVGGLEQDFLFSPIVGMMIRHRPREGC